MKRTGAVPVVILLFLFPLWGCGDDDPTITQNPRYSEVADSSFVVGDSSGVWVDNFTGNVTLLAGDSGTVVIEVTKWARRADDLSEIHVELMEVVGGVRVRTENPSDLDYVSVDLKITAPPDMNPQIRNDVGGTNYDGRPVGLCRFENGVGNVVIRLPADVNVTVALTAGVGSVNVGFPVDGLVSQQAVNGRIGTGLDGEIIASVGVGSITVTSQ